MIHLSSDYSDIDKELDRVAGMPSPKAKIFLDAVLKEAFTESQASVHVITGSLKSSGKSKSDTNKATHDWEGEFQFGGPSAGVNNPVDYAIYEKRRGGEHDFMANTTLLNSKWVAALLKGLSK